MKMNTLILVAVLVPLILGLSYWADDGSQIKPVYSASPGSLWKNLGSITCSHAAFAVTALDYSTVDAIGGSRTIEWEIPADADDIELRFQTDADGDDHVINIYLARGDYYHDGSTEDSFVLAFTLGVTGTTQTGPNSNVFCGSVTESQDYGSLGAIVDGTSTDRIARYIITERRGYNEMVIIATTLASSTKLYVDAAWYSE